MLLAYALSFFATFSQPIDGDSFYVRTDQGRQVELRLYGIDAPELSWRAGPAARDALLDLVSGKRLLVQPTGFDVYGRTIAWVYPIGNLIPVNIEMALRGHARPYLTTNWTIWLAANWGGIVFVLASMFFFAWLKLWRQREHSKMAGGGFGDLGRF